MKLFVCNCTDPNLWVPGERLRGDGDDMEHIVPQTDHLKDNGIHHFQVMNKYIYVIDR